jgi:hypothetical protein
MSVLGKILSWLTNGTLDRILDTVDHKIDNETQRQDIRARAITRFAEIEAEGRAAAMQHAWFWRVWALFAGSLGLWWAAVMLDTALPFISLSIPDLPPSVRPWADTIITSIFGSGAAVGAAQAIGSAIRGRR